MTRKTHLTNATHALHVVRPNEGLLGSLRILAGSEQTGGLYFAFESETAPAQPGGALDLHAHDEYDESEYVVTGEREIVVEEQRWQAGSGLFVLAPRRTRHTMRTVGSGPSRWLHFFSPAGLERYFVERERLREAGASAEELHALAERSRSSSPAPRQPALELPFGAGASARRAGSVATGQHTRNAWFVCRCSAWLAPSACHLSRDQPAGGVLAGPFSPPLSWRRAFMAQSTVRREPARLSPRDTSWRATLLALLSEQPHHAYALRRLVRERHKDFALPHTRGLYGALHRGRTRAKPVTTTHATQAAGSEDTPSAHGAPPYARPAREVSISMSDSHSSTTTPSAQRPHGVVIGGGLGGLCLAQGLLKNRGSVAVYERDRTPLKRKIFAGFGDA